MFGQVQTCLDNWTAPVHHLSITGDSQKGNSVNSAFCKMFVQRGGQRVMLRLYIEHAQVMLCLQAQFPWKR